MSAEKAGHAPEPWIILHCKMCTVIQDREQRNICELWTPTRAEAEPNARRIASAPELLALAKRYASDCAKCDGEGHLLVTFNEGCAEYEECPACADIRAVIEKAEGRA